MVKLLEGLPSATEHRPAPRRPVVTLAVTGIALVVAAAAGVILLVTGGDGGSTRAAVPAATSGADVALSSWVTGVDEACARTLGTHPILAEGATARTDPANVAAIDTATRDLATRVRDVERPTATADAGTATAAVQLGDDADQKWYALAALPADQVTTADLETASDAVAAFTGRLGELGAASCASIGRGR